MEQVAIAQKRCPIILVVEDDEDNLLYIINALNLFQYKYLAARNAVEGLALATKYQPDLILLDLKMPHTSGFELIKILKLNSFYYLLLTTYYLLLTTYYLLLTSNLMNSVIT